MILIIRISVLLLFLFLSGNTFCQEDSLTTKNYDELRALILEKLKKEDTLRALEIVEYHKNRATRETNFEEVVFGYGRKGYILGSNKDLERGIKNLDTSITLSQKYNFGENELRAHISKGMVYNQNGLFAESIGSYYTALDLAYAQEDYATAYGLINTLGWIKGNLEDHEGAIKILKKGLQSVSIENIELNETIATRKALKISFLTNIAKAHLNANRPDSSIFYLARAEEMSILPTDSCYMNIILEIKAGAHIEKNDFDQAREYLEESINYCNPMSDLDSLRYKGLKGSIYLGQKKYRQAISVLNEGLKIYKVPEDEEKYMKDYYMRLAKAYKKIGNPDSANLFLEKHLNTTSGFSELSKDLTNSFRAQETKEFENDLKKLSELKTNREQILLYGGIIGGLIILILTFSLIKSAKKRKENEENFKNLLSKVSAAKVPGDIINTKDEVLEEQSTSDVNPETTQQILKGLNKLESQNYFLHPGCNAPNVAKRIKTNTTYLSKVINAEFGKNFSTYINDLRINYAIVKLKQDPQFRNYTISAIATELGYKSVDSFTKYFKKDTGLLPSFYIKKLNQTP